MTDSVAHQTALHLSPHPDDEAIGCPVALLKLKDSGWAVINVVLTQGSPGQESRRRAEAEEAGRRADLGLLFPDPPFSDISRNFDKLRKLIADLLVATDAALVISPSPHDGHYSHEAVGRATQLALEESPRPVTWWMWGIWADLPLPTVLVPISAAEIEHALIVLDAYQEEVRRNDYRRLVQGRAMANAILGPERIFGFGSSSVEHVSLAELITEARYCSGRWRSGPPRILTREHILSNSGFSRDITLWVRAPSVRERLLSQ
ncbi:MAG: PIG-L deacetylase family protein [Pseudonocardiaceae bacterium]